MGIAPLRGNTLSTMTSILLVNMFTCHNDSSSEYRVRSWGNKYRSQYFAHYIHSDCKTCSSCYCCCYPVATAIGYTSVSQPPGRGPLPGPGINYTGPREVLLEFVILVSQAFFMTKHFIVEIF